jgi:hypothetical protein
MESRKETSAADQPGKIMIEESKVRSNKRSALVEDSGKYLASPRSGGEPFTKRRASNQHETIPVAEVLIDRGRTKDCISSQHIMVGETSTDACDLPDPTSNVSPDEFLLQLVRAQYGVCLEVKPALSLSAFFSEVSEEQMASYTLQVVGAVRNNDLESLKKLQREGQPLNCFNRFGESLLHMACRRGFESILEYLLEQPDINLRIRDDTGRTPLHDACWNASPQLNICKWIIQRDPSLFLITDRRGCTAFQYARPQHWGIWRKFLFDNRECLEALTKPEMLSILVRK